MGHPCGYFLGTSFSKICNFNREFKTKSFRGRISIICRSSVAAIYQNKPLSPVSFFNCRNGLLPGVRTVLLWFPYLVMKSIGENFIPNFSIKVHKS